MLKKLSLLFFLHIFLYYSTQTKPPESYSLIRGVNENINLNSGTVDLNIPLFDITEGQFKMTNVLKYESRGFSPNIPTSFVGLNWDLQQFGKITRESKRIDPTISTSHLLDVFIGGSKYIEANYNSPTDYFRNDCISIFSPPIGGISSYKKNIYDNPFGKDYISIINPINNQQVNYTGFSRNFDPDKYYFDFLGNKGYFLIDNEGTPIVYSENASLKIDVSNYGCHDIFGNITYSEIKITDDKGNKYFFGGTSDALDINYYYSRVLVEDIEGSRPDAYDFYSTTAKTNNIDSWLLKKIILSNGETVEAYYQNTSLAILNNYRGTYNHTDNIVRTNYGSWGNARYEENTGFPTRQNLINNNLTVINSRTINEVIVTGFCTPACGIYKSTQVDTYTKKAVLDSIKINNAVVSYKYNLAQTGSDLTNKYLAEVDIKRSNKLVKKINLIYEDLGLTNQRKFLKKIANLNEEEFAFEYYNTDDFPPLLLADYDVNSLGFWKGNLQPTYSQTPEDFSAYDTGLLKKVIYPTKGYTLYFYEHGDYSKIYTYSGGWDPYEQPPQLYNANNNVNAPRVFKKIESDLLKQEETFYEYKNDNGSSSGIVDGAVYDNFGYYSSKNTVNNLNSINSLRYSTVKVKKQGNGYAKYTYSDRVTNPDILTNKVVFRPNYDNYCTSYDQWKESNKLYLSKQSERGRIIKEEFYNNSDIKLKETSYEYNNFLNKFPSLSLTENCTDCKVSDLNYYIRFLTHNARTNNPVGCQKQVMYVPVIPYLLSSKKTKDFFGNKIIETTYSTDYLDGILKSYDAGTNNSKDYVWYPYPKQNKVITSEGTTIKKYLYPIDIYNENPCLNCIDDNTIVGGQYKTYQQLHYKNIFNPVVEIIKNNKNKFLLQENIFSPSSQSASDIYAIKKIRTSAADAIFDFSSYKIPIAKTHDDLIFDLYDNKKNLLQATNKAGIPTVTLWGYNQSLPLATIEGATYSQIMQAFGLNPNDNISYLSLDIVNKSNQDTDDTSELALISALSNFRKKDELKNFIISTYTYDPLIGLKSITPSSGIRESYKYDDSNRLSRVLDNSGNVLKEYNYNYAPNKYFNIAKSKSFVRNDCGYDAYGSTYNYVVPANKYISIIDQADADQQAQNEIDIHGQNTANINGTCGSPAFCSFNPENDINGVTSTIERLSDIKVRVQINIPISLNGLNSSNSNLPLQGFFIGEIADGCQLISSSNQLMTIENGRKWIVTMGINGSIYIKLFEGAISPSSTSAGSINLNFEYNINDSNSI